MALMIEPDSRVVAKISDWDFPLSDADRLTAQILTTIVNLFIDDKQASFEPPWPWRNSAKYREEREKERQREEIRSMSPEDRAYFEAYAAKYSAIPSAKA